MGLCGSFPLPHPVERTIQGLPCITDEDLTSSVGVFIAFTKRLGGVSDPPYDSLNLGDHVGDDPRLVKRNRLLLSEAFGAKDMPLVVPNQVHGTDLLTVETGSASELSLVMQRCRDGVDGVIVEATGIAALLCFADCVPVVLVASSGLFAVVHAGWRGALAGIVGKSAYELCRRESRSCGASFHEERTPVSCDGRAAASINMYVGPHICSSCFETSEEIAERFYAAFGSTCVPEARHVDLEAVVMSDAQSAGVDRNRIVSCGSCTSCNPDTYFSFRASGGICGRQGAFAFRR